MKNYYSHNNRIYPCIWFNNQASEAAGFYCSVFKNSGIISENGMVTNFELSGQKFMGLNGGPLFNPNPSISFYVLCETIDEINELAEKLTEGGKVLMPLDKYEWSEKYAWVEDKYGISWQLNLGKKEVDGQKFIPFLTFTNDMAGKAEEAMKLFTSVFENSSVLSVLNYSTKDIDGRAGVKHSQFNLGGKIFMAMDSFFPHQFGFNEGISLVVSCNTQDEIDFYWEKLTEGGEEVQCGWLKDKFGISWQIVPAVLAELMSDPQKVEAVTKAFMQMKKFDIGKLMNA